MFQWKWLDFIIAAPQGDPLGSILPIVLVAAALIMAFVFGGFASSETTFASETAFGLLIGVLDDAFIVRMVVMPSLLTLVRRAAWWMPRWLARIVPNLDTEGHGIDQPSSDTPHRDRELVR